MAAKITKNHEEEYISVLVDGAEQPKCTENIAKPTHKK